MGLDFRDGDSSHDSIAVAGTAPMVNALLYMNLSELKNTTEHLLTDNKLFFTFVYLTVYTSFRHPFVIVCFEVFLCEIHDMVPFCKLILYISVNSFIGWNSTFNNNFN